MVTKKTTSTTPKTKMPRAVTKQTVYRRRRKVRRRPTAGLLEPHQTIVLPIDPPLQENEQPLAVTPNAGDLLMRDVTLTQVVLVNTTDRVVAYMMTVVPRALVKLAMVPWRRVVADLGQAVKNSGILDRFAYLLRK